MTEPENITAWFPYLNITSELEKIGDTLLNDWFRWATNEAFGKSYT